MLDTAPLKARPAAAPPLRASKPGPPESRPSPGLGEAPLAAPAPSRGAGRFVKGRRVRPLSRFSAEEESPNIYLSMSDLMCLLLVCFLLLFSFTSSHLNQVGRQASQLVTMVKGAIVDFGPQEASAEAITIAEPAPEQVTRAILAMTQGGEADPGLSAEPAARPGAGEVRRDQGEKLGGALLNLLASSEPTPEGALPANETDLDSLLKQVQNAGSGQMEVEKQHDRLILRLPESITFDTASAELKGEVMPALKRLAHILAQREETRVVVSGHSDDVPIHNSKYASNWDLSAARAASVAHALMNRGLDPGRVTIRGLADTEPLLPGFDDEARSRNRRVEIELYPRQKG